MTTAFNGRAFLLKKGDGATSETFANVGGVRTNALTVNNNPVDISNMSSSGVQEMLPAAGVQSLEIQVDGVVDDDTQFEAVLAASHARTAGNYQLVSGNGDTIQANFVIASLSRNGAHDGAETYSLTLQSNGTITYTPGS